MPLDAVKTTFQVQGSSKGLEQIKARLKEEGVASLYAGAVAQALATAVRPHACVYVCLPEVNEFN